jgi:hypothetical protein
LPEKGDYFLPLSSYVKERLKAEQLEENHPIFAESQRCSQWLWTAKQYPDIAGWLNANEKPLALVVEATRRAQYYCPLVPKSKGKGSSGLITALAPSVQERRELANALTARAMLHLGDQPRFAGQSARGIRGGHLCPLGNFRLCLRGWASS